MFFRVCGWDFSNLFLCAFRVEAKWKVFKLSGGNNKKKEENLLCLFIVTLEREAKYNNLSHLLHGESPEWRRKSWIPHTKCAFFMELIFSFAFNGSIRISLFFWRSPFFSFLPSQAQAKATRAKPGRRRNLINSNYDGTRNTYTHNKDVFFAFFFIFFHFPTHGTFQQPPPPPARCATSFAFSSRSPPKSH